MAATHRNPLFDTQPKRFVAWSMLIGVFILFAILYGFRPVDRSHQGWRADGQNSPDGNRINRIPVDPKK